MYTMLDRDDAQLADLLELAGSPEAVQAAVLIVESTVGRRPTLAEVVAEILRHHPFSERECDRAQLAEVG